MLYPAWLLSIKRCEVVVAVVLCAVHSECVLSSWVRKPKEVGLVWEARENLVSPSSNFCVRATNDHKSAALTVFLRPRR